MMNGILRTLTVATATTFMVATAVAQTGTNGPAEESVEPLCRVVREKLHCTTVIVHLARNRRRPNRPTEPRLSDARPEEGEVEKVRRSLLAQRALVNEVEVRVCVFWSVRCTIGTSVPNRAGK